MKKNLLGLIVIFIFVSQLAFAAVDPELQKRLDAEAVAFFNHQAQDRAAFLAGHDISKNEQEWKQWVHEKERINRDNKKFGTHNPMPQRPSIDSGLSAFQASQQQEKQVFLAKIAKEESEGSTFSNSQPADTTPPADTAGPNVAPPSTPPPAGNSEPGASSPGTTR